LAQWFGFHYSFVIAEKNRATYLERPEHCWQSVERNGNKKTLVFCFKHTHAHSRL